MQHNFINLDGKQVSDGTTVTIDHNVDTMTITFRSLCGVSPSAIKEYLQRKWEVVDISDHHRDSFVQCGMADF